MRVKSFFAIQQVRKQSILERVVLARGQIIEHFGFENICAGVDRVASDLVALGFFEKATNGAVAFGFNESVTLWVFDRRQHDRRSRLAFVVFAYDGTFDPWGNGQFEFQGEFEINAFGGLKFTRHEVKSVSLIDFAITSKAEDIVKKQSNRAYTVPPLPADQKKYLLEQIGNP